MNKKIRGSIYEVQQPKRSNRCSMGGQAENEGELMSLFKADFKYSKDLYLSSF